MLSVLIDDYVERRHTILVIDPRDMETVAERWQTTDPLLMAMQETEYFAGRTLWSQMETGHWRLMVIRNMQLFCELSDDDRRDRNHAVVRSLCFLIAGLVYSIQVRSACRIDLLRMHRTATDEISYDFSGGLPIEIDPPESKSPFRVVVDNTGDI